MPLGDQIHTAFKMPFHPDSKGEECLMRVSIDQKWELDERILPTGNPVPLNSFEETLRTHGIAPVGQVLDLMHYTSKPIQLGDREFHGAVIEDPSKNLRLVYEVGEDYRHWMIWNMTGDLGFVCPEPQTWVVNAPNVKQPAEVTGFKTLAAGQTLGRVFQYLY